MYCHRLVSLLYAHLIQHEPFDEFGRLIKFHSLYLLAHPVQTRTLIAQDRPFAVLRRNHQRILKLCGFAVRRIRHSLRFPDCSAAETFHPFRKHDLISGFPEKLHHLLDNRPFAFRSPHALVDA